MKRFRRAAAVLATLLMIMMVSSVAGAAQPADDPFYRPPPVLPGRPGDLVRFQALSASALPGTPIDAHSWRIMYVSTGATGRRIAVTGSLFVPKTAYPGPRPLVSYAIGTHGLGDQCAPSYGLSLGLDYEGPLIKAYLDRGWAVVVSDYEGLGTPGDHTYMVGRSQGQAVLDALRAATRFPLFGPPADAPMVVAGYSQGGASAGWAAQLARSYAPELPIKAVAAGGVPADLTEVARNLDGSGFFAFLAEAAIGYAAAYPELPFADHLTAAGRRMVADARDDCVGESLPKGVAHRMSEYVDTDLVATAPWQARLNQNRLGDGAAPTVPVYLYHSGNDEIIPERPAELLRDRWCAAGSAVEWHEYTSGEHALTLFQAAADARDWLARRLAGEPVRSTC